MSCGGFSLGSVVLITASLGFARRYFKLYQSGLLEYSFDPEKAARDQMYLTQAAITTTPGHKDIHLDGSTAMFHVKCLTGEDFEKWMAALRLAPP